MEHYFTNNENLKSELREINYTYKKEDFKFISDNGVFSKDKIDFGSRLLVETYLEKNEKNNLNVLDVGCGYGFIGIVLSKVLSSKVDMIDINTRAIHLTEKNIKLNKVNAKAFISNAYENIQTKYDLIITNPPIRAGKKIVLNILKNAKNFLLENGQLWLVIRKDQGAKSILKDLNLLYETTLVKKSKGFYIISAK